MKKVFKLLFGWLGNRYLLAVLGLISLCLVIWFIGPLIAVAGWAPLGPEPVRWIAMIVAAFTVGLVSVGSALRQRRANAAVVAELAQSGGSPSAADPGAAEKQELRERFQEALTHLKRARFGTRLGARRYLYQLPWYVIIGPPGAGKTTALRNAGLEFPLSDSFGDIAVRGVGGTRNCDWWFTDEAVILDTAGRYTTQDSDEGADAAAWTGFLDLLRKYRRRRPLDGVVVAIGVDILAGGDPETLDDHARRVRQRLQEITGHLKIQLPVYFVVTKADLMPGLVETFDDLSRAQRQQVFGFTFDSTDPEARAPLGEFDARFDELAASLDERRLVRMGEEAGVEQRARIHAFPQQVAALRGALKRFAERAFGATRYESPVLLRGLYFTSGTQEGTPIDRLMSAMAGHFGLSGAPAGAYSGSGRSYFLTRLLRDVVFQEAALVGQRGFLARHRGAADRLAYGGVAAAAAVLALVLLTSYWRNEALIGQVEARLESTPTLPDPAQASLAETVRALNWLRDFPGGYGADGRAIPLLMGFGLYQGNKLGSAAESAYRRGLERILLPKLLDRLETQMSAARERKAFLYEALKVYLMLGHPQRLDTELVRTWVTLDWRNRLGGAGNGPLAEDFAGHLDALFATPYQAPPLNAPLVKQVRSRLSGLTLPERVYATIKSGPRASEIPEWRLPEVVGRSAAQYFRVDGGPPGARRISGFMTRAGYRKVFLAEGPAALDDALSETWVLHGTANGEAGRPDRTELMRRVTETYFAAYIDTWESYLRALELRAFTGLRDASEMMNVLGGLNSPIKEVLRAVKRETTLTAEAIAESEGGDSGTLSRVQSRVRQLLDAAGDTTGTRRVGDDPARALAARFSPIHELVTVREGGAAPIDQPLALITELSNHLGEIDLTAGQGDAAIAAARDQSAGRSIIGKVRLSARRQPEPLDRWMQTLAQQSAALTLRDARQRTASVWESRLAPFCRQALANRYPLAPDSPQDVNLNDFQAFFAPGGMFDSFFEQHLKAFVDTSVSPWRTVASAGGSIDLSSAALANLERAKRIQDAFFAEDGDSPRLSFQLRPVNLAAGASKVVLEIGEQRLVYQHGPSRLTPMRWPAPGGSQRARVQFTPLSGGPATGFSAEGPWAWFRLLDKARTETAGARDRIMVTFERKGMTAVYELQASSLSNPFSSDVLEKFSCRNGL